MGGAFTAVSDDVNAVLYNPAGAMQSGSRQAAFTHAKPFVGLDDGGLNLNFFSVLAPVSDVAAFGVAWSGLTAPVYSQDDAAFLAATSLNRWLPSLGPTVSVGANLHYLHQNFDLDQRTVGDSVFSGGRSAGAFAVDLGLQVRPDPRVLPGLSLGVAGRSLNEPDIGLLTPDPVRRELLAGAAYSWSHLTLAADLSQRAGDLSWRAGAELWFRDQTLGLRAGGNDASAGTGFTVLLPFGKDSGVFLDYAFTVPLQVEDVSGSHRAAVGYLF
jgi:hypothetical protein